MMTLGFPMALDAELDLWEAYWETHTGCCPDSVGSTLKELIFAGFENMWHSEY